MENENVFFNEWAKDYDRFVHENSTSFPFCGYEELCMKVIESIDEHSCVFDIGIGTGYIINRILMSKKVEVFGIDISEEMVDVAKARIPSGAFECFDIRKFDTLKWDYPSFDYILSTYTFHHFTDEQKIELVTFLLSKIKPNGQIIIGDIGFWDDDDYCQSKSNLGDAWDDDEYYLNINKWGNVLIKNNLKFEICRLSFCAYLIKIYR
jgi:putative AdoMet-dependent methyltransferase